MAASRIRSPSVKVRLNRSLFPADLISITSAASRPLLNVTLDYGTANDILKLREGGDESVGNVGANESIDIFVHGGESTHLEVPPLRLSRLRTVRKGSPLVLTMSWACRPHEEHRDQLCIVWTHEDRAEGHRPRVAFGHDAEVLVRYLQEWEKPVTGALLSLRRRVPEMTRRDIRERSRRNEKGGSAVKPDGLTRVASISTRGLRGFRSEAILRLAQPTANRPGSGLTIVVGANNTGKSTIWESFDATAKRFRNEISFSEGRRNRGTPGGVQLQLARTDGSVFTVQSRNANTSETRAWWDPADAADYLPEIISVPSRRQFDSTFSRNSTSQRDWMSSNADITRARQPGQLSQFTGRLFDLHNDETKKAQFDRLMSEVLGAPLEWAIELGEAQFGQSHYLKVTTGGETSHTSEGLGDGIISLMFILNALYDSEPESLIVLDEPELSLHPQSVRRLGRLLARYARDRQIVVFTHSPLLVSWDDIEMGAEIARVYKDGIDSHIAQLPRHVLEELTKARGGWKNPHVLGADATEALFLDDEIIVVEGQEDAVLLSTVFQEANVSPRGTVFGWGSGGGDANPSRIVALLDGLGFKKVVALLDADKAHEAEKIRHAYPRFLATTIPAEDIRDKPPSTHRGKVGLLDEHGRNIRAEYLGATQQVLESITAYFAQPHVESGEQ